MVDWTSCCGCGWGIVVTGCEVTVGGFMAINWPPSEFDGWTGGASGTWGAGGAGKADAAGGVV